VTLALIVDALRRNPFPAYAVLRRFRPVVRVRAGVWAVLDYESVRSALHDTETFSSRAAPPGGGPLDWLIFLDPPRHTKLRALISRTFAARAIAALEPRITTLAHELLDDVIERGEMDLVRDFSQRLPVTVIMELLGLPREDAPHVTRWADAILHLGDTILGGERGRRAVANFAVADKEMRPYLQQMLNVKRALPGDDLLTRMLGAEVDGERLTEDDIFGFFKLLLLAGTETTTNLIANAVLCFDAHPKQRQAVRNEPSRLPAAIEEVLRYRSPLQMVFRATTRDVSVRGHLIPRGALVLLMIGSANRDPAQFRNAHRFDIDRSDGAAHLGFGHGIHFCVGAALARLEARIALAVLLARVPDLRRRAKAWRPRAALNVHGPESLPIRFTPGKSLRGESLPQRTDIREDD